MFKNNKEKQTNERKSFKEFVSDNRGKNYGYWWNSSYGHSRSYSCKEL